MVVGGGGGGCTYDYSVSLSPNLWIMTFDLDLDLDLGLTIRYPKSLWSDRYKLIGLEFISYALIYQTHKNLKKCYEKSSQVSQVNV